MNNLQMNLRIKIIFQLKSLILYVTHALLGFYLCQSRIHKHYELNNA